MTAMSIADKETVELRHYELDNCKTTMKAITQKGVKSNARIMMFFIVCI